jgi:hypothetical protein
VRRINARIKDSKVKRMNTKLRLQGESDSKVRRTDR